MYMMTDSYGSYTSPKQRKHAVQSGAAGVKAIILHFNALFSDKTFWSAVISGIPCGTALSRETTTKEAALVVYRRVVPPCRYLTKRRRLVPRCRTHSKLLLLFVLSVEPMARNVLHANEKGISLAEIAEGAKEY